jgi:hypothetical protein
MEVKGTVGTSPVVYDLIIDNQLNFVGTLSYKDPGSATVVGVNISVPVSAILTAVVAKLNNPLATEIEQGLVAALGLYLQAQPAATPA